MLKISNEELTKITQFVAGCNDMIGGKFLLADIKINKLLNMIAGSEELYNYIKECLVDFDFYKEYHKAEIHNRLNDGVFVAPTTAKSVAAFVFCILVECDARRIDFHKFVNENFPKDSKAESYKQFAEVLLIPFKNAVVEYFNLDNNQTEQQAQLANAFRQDLQAEPVFANERTGAQSYAGERYAAGAQSYANEQTYYNGKLYAGEQQHSNEQQGVEMTSVPPVEVPQQQDTQKIWDDIKAVCDNTINCVYTERKIKADLREELIYILKTIKYSVKYKDVKILSALVTAFGTLTKKLKSVQFVFAELEEILQELY